MTINLEVYQNIRSAYQTFSYTEKGTSQSKIAEKAVFSALAALYTPEEMQGTALSTGVYYRLAQTLEDRFPEHPQSLARLKPKASQYTQIFQRMMTRADQSETPPATLKKDLTDLRTAHIYFTNMYIEEFKRAYPESSDVVQVLHADTIKLFLECISQSEKLKDLAATQDAALFTTLPRLAVEKLLASDLETPALFKQFNRALFMKRNSYNDLSPAEKANLHLKLLNEPADLQPATHELFKSIDQICYHLDRKESALVFRESLEKYQMLAIP